MPELPEVETTKRGIEPYLLHQTIQQLVIRHWQLRWPIPHDLPDKVVGHRVLSVSRRAKYLLIQLTQGSIMIHLGMSGRLRVLDANTPAEKHDHVDFMLSNQKLIRYTDPRRFGSILWVEQGTEHLLLSQLGPEPLEEHFNAHYFYAICQKRTTAIKLLIMDNKVVVGVGNIYATEALFASKLHPQTPAKHLSQAQCAQLVDQIKQILQQAITQGGTTLKDFVNSDGKPGYFSQKLWVYGRKQQPCLRCGHLIETLIQGQRTTSYCPHCQPIWVC